jgi:hypothetical protein
MIRYDTMRFDNDIKSCIIKKKNQQIRLININKLNRHRKNTSGWSIT